MEIAVLIKMVVQPFGYPGGHEDADRLDFGRKVINPADTNALEAAMHLKSTVNGRVTVITMGPEEAGSILFDCLARGADRAAHLCDKKFAGADTLATARTLAAAIRHLGSFDLVLCGWRSIDSETGHVGAQTAVLLGIPYISGATGVQVSGEGRAEVSLLTDREEQLLSVPLPALVSVRNFVNHPREPTIAGIKRARSVPILSFTAEDLGMDGASCGTSGSRTRICSVEDCSVPVRKTMRLIGAEASTELLCRLFVQDGVT